MCVMLRCDGVNGLFLFCLLTHTFRLATKMAAASAATVYYKVVKQVKNPDTGEVELRPAQYGDTLVYKVGGFYVLDAGVEPRLCHTGFHACKHPAAILDNCYGVAGGVLLEVDLGDPAGVVGDGYKFVSASMFIRRIVTWQEAFAAAGATWTDPVCGDVFTFTVNVDKGFYVEVLFSDGMLKRVDEVGTLHSPRDKPAVEDADGGLEWWARGRRHRLDGPAVVKRTVTEWWDNGMKHRRGLPAVEHGDGRLEWWEHGHCFRREQRKPVAAVADAADV